MSLLKKHLKICNRIDSADVVYKEVLESNNGSEFQCKNCDGTFKSRRLVCEHYNSVHSENQSEMAFRP